MTKTDIRAAGGNLSERLDGELTALAQSQFDTPEFDLLFSTPLTMERARFLALQFVLYNVNRRDCWGFVQARAPWETKRTVWEHEKDELYYDEIGGADHRVLMAKEALALGATEEEVAAVEATPLLAAAQMAFIHLAENLPWLGALTASHFLERRNNSELMEGGGFSQRWRDKMTRELNVDAKTLISSNVHVIAEIAHSDSIWDAISANVVDDETYRIAWRGAEACAVIDRAYRAGLAYGMERL